MFLVLLISTFLFAQESLEIQKKLLTSIRSLTSSYAYRKLSEVDKAISLKNKFKDTRDWQYLLQAQEILYNVSLRENKRTPLYLLKGNEKGKEISDLIIKLEQKIKMEEDSERLFLLGYYKNRMVFITNQNVSDSQLNEIEKVKDLLRKRFKRKRDLEEELRKRRRIQEEMLLKRIDSWKYFLSSVRPFFYNSDTDYYLAKVEDHKKNLKVENLRSDIFASLNNLGTSIEVLNYQGPSAEKAQKFLKNYGILSKRDCLNTLEMVLDMDSVINKIKAGAYNPERFDEVLQNTSNFLENSCENQCEDDFLKDLDSLLESERML